MRHDGRTSRDRAAEKKGAATTNRPQRPRRQQPASTCVQWLQSTIHGAGGQPACVHRFVKAVCASRAFSLSLCLDDFNNHTQRRRRRARSRAHPQPDHHIRVLKLCAHCLRHTTSECGVRVRCRSEAKKKRGPELTDSRVFFLFFASSGERRERRERREAGESFSESSSLSRASRPRPLRLSGSASSESERAAAAASKRKRVPDAGGSYLTGTDAAFVAFFPFVHVNRSTPNSCLNEFSRRLTQRIQPTHTTARRWQQRTRTLTRREK